MIRFDKSELQARILLVENISHMARILREILMNLGFRDIHRVTNVIYGYQFVEKNRTDLIIAEINISPIGGAQLCQTLRLAADSPGRQVPVLLTLADPTAEAVVAARDCGAHFVLAKPVSTTALATKIAALLRNPPPFVTAESYAGPDRRRRRMPYAGEERRWTPVAEATYQLPAHALLGLDAAVLAGRQPPPPHSVQDDNSRLLRPPVKPPVTGRQVAVSQLAAGMELAEPVKDGDDAVVVPFGVVVNEALVLVLRRLAERGRITPMVRIVG